MVKYIALWYVKPGLDIDETWKEYPKHTEWAKSHLLPELKRYVQNKIIKPLPGGEVDFFAITEMWFNDLESAERAIDRLKNATPDEFSVERTYPEKVKRVLAQEMEIGL